MREDFASRGEKGSEERLIDEARTQPLHEDPAGIQVVVGDGEKLPGVKMGGSGRPGMGGLRNDGVVAFARKFEGTAGVVDDYVDALVLKGINGPATCDELVGGDDFLFNFDNIDLLKTGGD